jgi:hypothetical protein
MKIVQRWVKVRDLCPGPILEQDWSGPFSAGPYIGLSCNRKGGRGGGFGSLTTIHTVFLIYYIIMA